MGLNIRRSIKIGKHTKLNISKSGLGISTGTKGARVSIGPHGVRKTIGIPGTGISYTKQQNFKKRNKIQQISKNPPGSVAFSIFVGFIVFLCVIKALSFKATAILIGIGFITFIAYTIKNTLRK